MSATLANAKAILEADTGNLVLLATGGIWDWDETGRLGINRSNAATATAFVNGIIQPCLMLKLRSSVPYGGIADDSERIVTARDMLEIWALQDSGFATIKSMLGRSYTLLQGEPLGGFVCRWALTVQLPRDIEADANQERADYAVVYTRS
jgi:hypothetical protein